MRHRAPAPLRLALAALATACAAPTPPPAPQPAVRLVSWNIHHGEGLDGRVDLERIASELRAVGPDLICLQEVDVGTTRTGGADIPGELAQRLGMHALFGKNIDYQGGDYGNAILSRWPIAWHRNHHYRMLRAGEQRGLLTAGVACPGAELVVGCTHLDYRPDDGERRSNAAEILAATDAWPFDLLAGDFNDRPEQPVHALLTSQLLDCWSAAGVGTGGTFPAHGPDRRIDWVLRDRRGRWNAIAAEVVPTAASDHALLVIDFAPAQQPTGNADRRR